MPVPMKQAPQQGPAHYSKYDPENGPFWTCQPDGEAKVLFAETGYASEKKTPSKTLIEVFDMAVKKCPNKVVLRTENMPMIAKGATAPPPIPLGQWKSWTWKKYKSDVRKAAKAMIKLGHEQHDAVNVFGFNSPEWFIGAMGAIFSGGKVAGIYPTDTPEQVQFKSNHSGASIAICEDNACLAKYTEVIEDLPYLKAIVMWAGDQKVSDLKREDGSVCKVMTFHDFMKLGDTVDNDVLDTRIAQIKPTHCCALIYTSGTTGFPKAVMISHDNLAFESNSVLPLSNIGLKAEEERIISYLPLSHVAGMMVDIVCPIIVTAYLKGWMSVNFARPYDLKAGTIGARLTTIEPTLFLGVPRVWEKIAEKLKAIGAQTTGLKKKLSTKAKAKGLAYQEQQQLGGSGKVPSFYGIFSKLLKVIKKKLGLHKAKFTFAGAAPMTRETLSYFGSLGINVNEVYGMSESTGATTWSTDAAHQWGTVGFELPGTEVKVLKKNADGVYVECPRASNVLNPTEEEQGEICFRGRHIMMGYMAQPRLGEDHVAEIEKKNSDAIDENGWLHSGDKGAVSKKGMVRITGRYKELIIGAGGENVAPVPIEDNVKALCPYISNVMMVGDKKKYMTILITLKAVGATGELPGSDKLEPAAAVYGKTISDACENEKLIADITKALKDTGANGDCTPSNAAKIQKFTILPIDFSVQTGELTATLKLKRSVVADKYEDIIEKLYDPEMKDAYVPYSLVGSMTAAYQEDPAPRGSFAVAKDEELDKAEQAAEAELTEVDPAVE
mmetsp:Transcript_44319/g.96470  ORF Transcript_44319/g.96470 Transcript_44319/m.96470 type:complete len:781 (+) Transcript_44319:49-2391(+)